MANGDRWRNPQDRYGSREERGRWGEERGSRDARGDRRDGGDRPYGDEGFRRGGGIREQDDYGRGAGGFDPYRGGDDRRLGGDRRGRYGGDYSGRERFGRGAGDDERPGEERGFWDRASDEVSSWFGDQDAERRRMAETRGDHRGRGPKNYTRSDERIREDVSDRLSDDPYVDASEIEVTVTSCEVTLSGTVASREAKRRAEDCAERVSGVRHVQNNLRVMRPADAQGTHAEVAGSPTAGSRTGPQGTGLGGVEVGPQASEAGRRRTGANT